jgi:hypothetical protein
MTGSRDSRGSRSLPYGSWGQLGLVLGGNKLIALHKQAWGDAE